MDLEFYVWKIFFETLCIEILLIFFNFDNDFFKKNLHVVEKPIDHVFDVSAVYFFLSWWHCFGVFADLIIDLDFVIWFLWWFCLFLVLLFVWSFLRFGGFVFGDDNLKPLDWDFDGFGDNLG